MDGPLKDILMKINVIAKPFRRVRAITNFIPPIKYLTGVGIKAKREIRCNLVLIGPVGAGAQAGSLGFKSDINFSPEEKRKPPVEFDRVRPADIREYRVG